MRKLSYSIHAMILILLAVGCQRTVYVYMNPDGSIAPGGPMRLLNVTDWQHADTSGSWKGTWAMSVPAIDMKLPVSVQFLRPDGSRQCYALTGDDAGQYPAGPVHQVVARDAGTLAWDGDSDGKTAAGSIRFSPKPQFGAQLAAVFGKPPGADEYFELAMDSLDLASLRKWHSAGPDLSLAEIRQLRNAGVQDPYVAGMNDAGFTFSAAELVALHDSGVEADYVKSLAQSKMKLDANRIIELHNSGIPAAYATDFVSAGYHFEAGTLIELHNSGIDAAYARSLFTAGYRFDANDLIQLHDSGIDADYAAAMKKAGCKLSVPQLIQLHNSGVDADYAAALVAPNRQNLSVEQIIDLRNRGLDAAAVRKLRE